MPTNPQQTVVISSNVGSLLEDFDIFDPMPNAPPTAGDIFGQTQQRAPSAVPNLLDEELSSILGTDLNIPNTQTSMPINPSTTSTGNLLDDIFGDLNLTTGASAFSFSPSNTFALPKEVR
jgi:hypothetical protein